MALMGKMNRVRTALGLRPFWVLALLGGLLAACDEAPKAEATQGPPPSVTVAKVERKDVTPTFNLVGRVVAIDSVNLRARVEGFLEEWDFVEGHDVDKDQLLFVIEQAPYEAEVQRAKGDLERAKAEHTNAKLALERAKKLLTKGNISQAKVDDATADEKVAAADVLQMEAALETANLDLQYTEIHSPIKGRIGKALYSVGNLVGPSSDPLATVVSLDPIYVEVNVSERDMLDVRRDGFDERADKVTPFLKLSDGSDYPESGKFIFINNEVDPGTDTILVRAQFPNPETILLPEQFVTVIIKRREPTKALVIPQAAVQENQSGRFVLVVGKDDEVEQRQVTLGEQDGTEWVVEKGLNEGESVIVQGLQKVKPGGKVNPVMAATPAEG
ncbi:MAG: efflux RND transporter periplasmic adaptor subunit [Pseudomonadota bacterium]